MRFLSWLAALPFLLLIVSFAVANHESVTLSFWPFDIEVTMPLSLMTVVLLLVGYALGSLATWLRAHPLRREAKRLRREAAALKSKDEPRTPPSFPPLPFL